MTKLSEFLSMAGHKGFVRGRHDCMLFVADWSRELTGKDPAADLRERYATEAEAHALIEQAGGYEQILDGRLAPHGWRHVEGPRQAGDIALAIAKGLAEPTAGVCMDGAKIALVTARGLVVWPLQALAVWRLEGAHG